MEHACRYFTCPGFCSRGRPNAAPQEQDIKKKSNYDSNNRIGNASVVVGAYEVASNIRCNPHRRRVPATTAENKIAPLSTLLKIA
jgi:hypothetical protein